MGVYPVFLWITFALTDCQGTRLWQEIREIGENDSESQPDLNSTRANVDSVQQIDDVADSAFLNKVVRHIDEANNENVTRAIDKRLTSVFRRVFLMRRRLSRQTSKASNVSGTECEGIRVLFKEQLKQLAVDIDKGAFSSLVNKLRSSMSTRKHLRFRHVLQKIWHLFKIVLRSPAMILRLTNIRTKLGAQSRTCNATITDEDSLLKSSFLAVSDSLVQDRIDQNMSHTTRNGLVGPLLFRKQLITRRVDEVSQVEQTTKPATRILPKRLIQKLARKKWKMLLICMMVDAFGFVAWAGWLLPPLGAVISASWSPIASMIEEELFEGTRSIFKTLVLGFVEGLFLPFMSLVPTAVISWYYSYHRGLHCAIVRDKLQLPDRTRINLLLED
eukprot:TRINITY_DN5204_c0_g4_i1.p1 TRINITY_DN5204_c0_g4~~TRINITY_DN5204_c0_g4_i1.p1  ORF type:complete len:388 (-),score=19.46 TRINITY_DN5204_c0_g4_i1:17-1180(-)